MTEPATPTHDAEIVTAGVTPETGLRTADTPHSRAITHRTPGDTRRSAVTVTVQVVATLGHPASPGFTQRSPDEDDTNVGGGSKGSGLSGTEMAPDQDDTDTRRPPSSSTLDGTV